MDRVVMDYLARKMRGNEYSQDNRNTQDYRAYPDMRGGDMTYPAQDNMRTDMMNFPMQDNSYGNDNRGGNYIKVNGYPMDQRQGVKGTGPYGIGGSMHDRASDGIDGHYEKMPELTKQEKLHWEDHMQNTDGTIGPHFTMQQVISAAEKLGIRFKTYDEKDLCLITNMFYSDYSQVWRKYIPKEKELIFYVDSARAWFDDPDGPEPEDKLSRQYHCMINFRG